MMSFRGGVSMGIYPTKAADNIYCQCRKAAVIKNEKLRTREGAAELLGYSVSALAGWELETDRPSPEAVMLMAEVYQAPELKNYYCRKVCPLGLGMPELKVRDIDRITILAISAIKKVCQSKENLLDIVADGVISESEKPELEEIIKNMDELTDVAQSLKAWAVKNME